MMGEARGFGEQGGEAFGGAAEAGFLFVKEVVVRVVDTLRPFEQMAGDALGVEGLRVLAGAGLARCIGIEGEGDAAGGGAF